jgi:NADPH:quinone reductase-like Zn-dependent oxidoreductase
MSHSAHARSVRFDTYGGPEVLHFVDREVPAPGEGKVRVRVRAVGLNPADSKTRGGAWSQALPSGIGRELAGTVESIGDGVTTLSIGDDVFGFAATGALAELVVTSVKNLTRKPEALDWTTAGGLALAGLTAWNSTTSQNLGPGDTVLVSAAAGGVGVIAAQLARRSGARVIGTASSANHDFLRSLGVEPVAYGPGLVDAVRTLGTVTAVLDNNGSDTVQAGLALGVSPDRINSIATDPARWGIRGVGRGDVDAVALDELARLVIAGELIVPIDSTFALDDVVAAFEKLDGGHARGKIVVIVA